MDETYFEADYIDARYFNTIARASANFTAFDIIACTIRAIHLMAALTYKIKEETRLHMIREETRLRSIASETRLYQIKEG